MKSTGKTSISMQATIHAPLKEVWKIWTTPGDIVKWNNASPDWHTPGAENDLRKGGKFNYRMEARDGSIGFDFYGVYDRVVPNELIEYTLGDGRKVKIVFTPAGEHTKVHETFEAESENTVELQRSGWQAILDNFKRYAESGSH
jgi:uncharacterized protein YndB with AHSA1/START domain